MQLSLEKCKGQYKLYIIKADKKKEKFDYIKFINMIYEGNKVEHINYGQDITQDEREQVKIMLDQIDEVINKEKAEN